MGDIGDLFRDLKEANKEHRQKKNEKYEPQLLEIGAIEKSYNVYEYDGWFCYPTKRFAMNKKNSQERINLQKFIDNAKQMRQ